MRILDTFFPVAKGGTYCIPGPFGAGKTVLQQLTSRHADVDVVIIAACGERAGEVVETLREFPGAHRPAHGPQPHGAHRHHLQHQLHAGGGPRGLRVHGRDHRRVLPADGPARAAAGRLHLALGAGAARDVGPPGGDPRRGGVPRLPRVGDRRLLRARRRRAPQRRLHRLGDHRRHREPGRRRLRGAGDAVHAQGGGRLPRPLAAAVGRAPLPGHRPARELEQVREHRPGRGARPGASACSRRATRCRR